MTKNEVLGRSPNNFQICFKRRGLVPKTKVAEPVVGRFSYRSRSKFTSMTMLVREILCRLALANLWAEVTGVK